MSSVFDNLLGNSLKEVEDASFLDHPEEDIEKNERLVEFCQTFETKYLRFKEYNSSLAEVVLNSRWKTNGISNVLLIFLCAPHGIVNDREKGWNPFLKHDGTYVSTLAQLNKLMKNHPRLNALDTNSPLNLYAKTDCFPHKIWKKSSEKTVYDQNDLNLGTEYLEKIISILQPKLVVCFGKEPSFVMKCVIKELEPCLKHLSKFKFSVDSLFDSYVPENGQPVKCAFVPHPGYYNRKLELTKPL
jgi:hypothetical protein